MSRHRARTAAVLAAAAAVLLAGCGVPLQSAPQPIPADAIPGPLPSLAPSPSPTVEASSSATPSPTPTVAPLRLWFVREDGLVAATSTVPAGSSPSAVLEALAVGPTGEQVEDGLRTIAVDPLTGLPLVSVPATSPSPGGMPDPPIPGGDTVPPPVTVQVSAAFSALPPTEQVLLLGQVVLSLTGAGADTVSFTDEAGTILAVPLPDGRLLDGPARARDYAPLIVQP